jgi:hybrid cluster-associated redox disulfide protein
MNDQDDKLKKALPTRSVLAEMTVEMVLTSWPQTAVIFHEHKMACVGCAVASFYSIADAASIYGLAQEQFLNELITAISQPKV